MNHIDPVRSFTFNFLKIHSNIIPHLRLGLTSGLFPSGFPIKTLYTLLLSPMCVTHAAHLIRLDLTTRQISGRSTDH